jgi:membrane protease YdiL (CAAX protease family)
MSSLPASQQTISVMPPPSTIRNVFFGPKGLRSGWRLLIFFLLLVAFESVIRGGIKRVPVLYQILKSGQNGVIGPQYEFVFQTATITGLFLAAFIMARIEKRRFSDYGFPWRQAFGKFFWQGVLWGLALESAAILGIYALHGFSFGEFALSGMSLVKYAAAWALAFVLVGIFEEFTFRGYTLSTLAEGIGFWPAAFIFSALFGAAHLGNPREDWVGALSVVLFGVFACLTLRRTGSLWFAIGFHAAADYAETFIFSVPDSGMLPIGHLLNSSFHGPRWLTGGAVGPEASVIEIGIYALGLLVYAWLYPAKNRSVNAAPLVTSPVTSP